MPGDGPSNAKLLVVGEAPNCEAELKGQPFVGWTGRVVASWLDYIGLQRAEVYMTNVVKCVLREKTGKVVTNGYGPLGQWVLACRPWLDQELNIVNPKVVVTVGAAALNSLLNISIGVFQQRGYCQKVKGRFYCALYHPGRRSVEVTEDDKKVLDQVRSLLTMAL